MKLKRGMAAVIVAGIVLIGTIDVASAKDDTAATAQSVADGFVTALMPPAGDQTGICDTKTETGFIAKRASYLASCTGNAGTFQFFVVTAATKKGALDIPKGSYVGTQLGTFCTSGHVYSVGVKRKFIAIYAETGDAVVAKDMRDMLAGQVPTTTPGYIKPFTVC
jgi:hypothetical protein